MTDFVTLSNTKSSITGGSNAAGFPAVTVITGEFDATKRPLAQNDTIAIAKIPAGSIVLATQWEVVTVEGAARNFSVGITGAATKYLGSTSANSATTGAALNMTLSEGTPNTVAAVYDSAEANVVIGAVTSGGLTATKIRVRLVVATVGL
jgi:hypothetical protein